VNDLEGSHSCRFFARQKVLRLIALMALLATPATTQSSQLTNISTRGVVQTGDNVQIGGFIIGGTDPKTVLIRARGPVLTDFGVPGVLNDPFLQLFSGQTVIADNDNWETTSTLCQNSGLDCGGAAEITATGLDPCVGNLTGCSRESAILVTLDPGPYTAIVSGLGGATGVGLVEVFEVGTTGTSRLTNISTRGVVGTGDNVMIGGFIIGGTDPKTVLVRARGPVLTDFGVPGELSDPFLQLFSGQTVIAQNDNWQVTDPLCGSPAVSCGGETEIIATGLDPCVGDLTGCSQESAILITLPPGPYTAIVSGVGSGTGVGLVEVFEVLDSVAPVTPRGLFFAGDIVGADDLFQAELAADPTNQEALFFRSITRLLRIVEENQDGPDPTTFTDSLKEILDQFGFAPEGRSIFDFSARPLPSDSPTGGDVQEFLLNVILPEIIGAIEENLSAIAPSFAVVLTPQELAAIGIFDEGPLEIDFGDVKLFEAALGGLKAGLLISLAYDLDLDIDQLTSLQETLMVQQDIINANPSFLTLTGNGANLLAQAKAAISEGIDDYLVASEFIRSETDDQSDDFITIQPSDLQQEADLRGTLSQIQASLSGVTTITIKNQQVDLDLSRFFDTPFDLRDVLPPIAFDPQRKPSNFIEPGTFPDPTFNGVLPGLTQERLTDLLGLTPG